MDNNVANGIILGLLCAALLAIWWVRWNREKQALKRRKARLDNRFAALRAVSQKMKDSQE